MSSASFIAVLLLRAFIADGGASEVLLDQRPASDFISMELDKTSAVKGGEAILTLRYPAECGFSGIRSPDFDARENTSELIEYQPHRHAQAGKSLVPITSKYSGGLTTSYRPLNQSPTYAGQTHKHHLRESRFSLKFASAGEVLVGPLEVICEGKAFRTARRTVRVSSGDENLFKAVDPRVLGGPDAARTSGPMLEPERPATPPSLPIPPPRAADPGPSFAPLADSAGLGAPGLLALAAGLLAGLGMIAWLIARLAVKLPGKMAGATSNSFSSRLGRFSPFPARGKPIPPRQAAPHKKASVVAERYEIMGQLGEGGMGTVLLGHDTKLSRKVAIKQMRPEIRASPKECARFLAEARIIAKLRHPYIVGIHDIIEESGQIYLILDFVDGKTLFSILDEKGRLPLPECKQLFAQVCEAVDFAHRNKVLHRDLKPANILINKEGFAFVTDFGIAREAKDTIGRATQTEVSGSPAYMAPEQHLGEAGKASDIFSLGVMLYEMLTGQRPFTGLDFLAQKERRMYRPPSDVIKELNFRCDRLFEAVLAPAADQRPESALTLYQRLKEL